MFGKLRLDSEASMLRGGRSGPVIVPGDPQGSRLIQAVGYESEQLAMPPSGRLAPEAVEALKLWVAARGALARGRGIRFPHRFSTAKCLPGQSTGAWQPLEEPAVPRNSGCSLAAWSNRPIRALQTRGERSFSPAEPADPYTLLRRLTLDLTGLPPTPEQIDRFLADRSPEALESVVDGLLASSAFGRTVGGGTGWICPVTPTLWDWGRRIPAVHAWRYRDYVIRAFQQRQAL